MEEKNKQVREKRKEKGEKRWNGEGKKTGDAVTSFASDEGVVVRFLQKETG